MKIDAFWHCKEKSTSARCVGSGLQNVISIIIFTRFFAFWRACSHGQKSILWFLNWHLNKLSIALFNSKVGTQYLRYQGEKMTYMRITRLRMFTVLKIDKLKSQQFTTRATTFLKRQRSYSDNNKIRGGFGIVILVLVSIVAVIYLLHYLYHLCKFYLLGNRW